VTAPGVLRGIRPINALPSIDRPTTLDPVRTKELLVNTWTSIERAGYNAFSQPMLPGSGEKVPL